MCYFFPWHGHLSVFPIHLNTLLLPFVEETVHPVFRSSSEKITPYVVVDSLCVWEEESSTSAYATILNPFLLWFDFNQTV